MVFSRIPRPVRIGLLVVAVVATTAATLLDFHRLAVPIGFGAIYLLLALRIEIHIHPSRRTYVWRDGLFPLMASRRGTFQDFKRVHIEAQELLHNVYETGTNPTEVPFAYLVTLEWSKGVGARPFLVTRTNSFETASALANQLSRVADLPVVESSELRHIRPQLGPAPYDDRIVIPPPTERPVSLAAKLRG